MAQSLGLPLGESMRRHTHRQHKLTVAWLGEQWNKPDRHDHYLMQIAWLLLLVNSTKEAARGIEMKDRKLKFENEKQPASVQPSTPEQPSRFTLPTKASISQESPERQRLREQATSISRSTWRARMSSWREK